MPNFANIVLQDGKGTPVNHTFEPLRNPSGTAEWAESSVTGSLTSRNSLSVQQKLPGAGRGTLYEGVTLVLPYVVTETINGVAVDKVMGNVRVNCEIISSQNVPKQYRTDARVLMKNALLNVDIAKALDDGVAFT